MQHTGVADTSPYNERLESVYVVESAVVLNVDIPVSAYGYTVLSRCGVFKVEDLSSRGLILISVLSSCISNFCR